MSMFEQFFSAVQSKTSAVVGVVGAVGAAAVGGGGPVGAQFTIGDRRVEVIKQIAEGGFAFVYLVREVGTEQLFAVKRLLVNDDEDFAKVKEEIEFMRKLPPHKNIVEYRGASVGSSRSRGAREVYIMMEFCQGPSLYSILDERFGNHLPEAEILSIFSDVCEGVAHMHSMNPPIAHRDIKVENVLKHQGRYKLCDFGSATTKPIKAESVREINAADDLIQRHTTMMYRSPEMVDLYQKKLINEKVDIWALGCLLYRLCFFRHPFEEGSGLQILNVRYSIPENSPYSDTMHSMIKYMIEPDPDVRPDIYQVLERVSQLRSIPCAVSRPLRSSASGVSTGNTAQVQAAAPVTAVATTLVDDTESVPPPVTEQSNSFIFALLDGGSATPSPVVPSSPSRAAVASNVKTPSTPPPTPVRVSAPSLNNPSPTPATRVGLNENLTESIDSVLFGLDDGDGKKRSQKAVAVPVQTGVSSNGQAATQTPILMDHSQFTSTSFFAQAPSANTSVTQVTPSASAPVSASLSSATSATASPRSRLVRAQSELTPSSIVDLSAFTQPTPQTPPAVAAVAASASSSHRRSPSLSVVDSSWFAAPTDIQPQPPPYQPTSPDAQAAGRAAPLQPVSAVPPLVAGMHPSPRGHQRAVSTGDWFGTHGAAHQPAPPILQPVASSAGRSASAARTYDELRNSLNEMSLSSGGSGSTGSSPVVPLSSSAGVPFTGFQSAPQAQGVIPPIHQHHHHHHHQQQPQQQQQQQQYQAASAPSLFNMFATAASTRGTPGSPAAGRGSGSPVGDTGKPDPFSNLVKW